jgi:omega-amidase
MTKLNVAAAQFDIAWEDKPANHAAIERLLDDADIAPGAFVLLPELGDTGFSFNLDAIVDDRSLAWACRIARERRIWLQHGYPERGRDGRGRNCASIVSPDGQVIATYRKVHPFSYGKEIEHYAGGDELVVTDIDGITICPQICYDLRFPELWRLGAINGAELFTIGASWPSPRQHHWRTLLIARAIENQGYVIAVNRIGRDPHLSYLGGSMIISPKGDVLAEGGPDEATVLTATLDFDELREWRDTFPAMKDIHREFLGNVRVKRSGV